MASKFWVGGGTNNTWASSPTTNWANSSGGAGNQTAPGTGDMVVFDGASGTGNSVISASTAVQGLECDGSTLGTGAYAGTLTHNTGVTLTLNTGAANTLRFSSGMTYTPASSSSLVTLTHTTGTANIKSYGKSFWALTINGAGGTTQTLDTLLVNAGAGATLTVSSGIFDANGGSGGPFTITANVFNFTGTTTRSVILGGNVTIGGNVSAGATIWNAQTTTALTFTKNSANIIVLANVFPSILGVIFAGGSLSYNDLTLNAVTTGAQLNFTGNNTFTHFANNGWCLSLTSGQTQTISNPFSWAGTAALPILIIPASNTTTAISCPSGTCTLSWGVLYGVAASGGATFVATNTANIGFNSGWSITPPADSTSILTAAQITTLGRTLGEVACGTVTTGGSTTSVPTSALDFLGVAASGVVADQFKGRTILFRGNTTTAGLRGASSAISANTASDTPTFTVATLPATPANTDTFCVI